MRRRWIGSMLLLAATVLLSGCWSKYELTERGFVLAASIDEDGKDKIRLTAQIYKSGTGGAQSMQPNNNASYLDLQMHSATVFGAARDAVIKLGRKLQWSHMRTLLISEEVARTRNLDQLLDFFFRANELRGTTSLLITKGKASDYLHLKPLLESTIGEQLKSIEQTALKYSGKTLHVSLTDFNILSREEAPVAVVPYASIYHDSVDVAAIAGAAIVKFPEGTMTGMIPPGKMPFLLMLMNELNSSSVELPCNQGRGASASFVIQSSETKIKPVVANDKLKLEITANVTGILGELGCLSVFSSEDVQRLETQTKQLIEKNVQETLRLLQQQRADVIGIGRMLYRHNKKLWAAWKTNWPERFADSDFSVTVKVKLTNTGFDTGKPFK